MIKKIKNIPKNPGVYIFKDKAGKIIYIGKATNLRSRVQSYFRGGESARLVGAFIKEIAGIEIKETDSVLEALILESSLIKKYQPKYNVKDKDDKSFSYFAITKEKWPKVVILRGTELDKITNSKIQIISNQIQNSKNILNTRYKILYTKTYGPYTSKKQMEVALKIVRKIFPFHNRSQKTEKGCLDFQIGLCPGPYAGEISRADYLKNIRGIKMILEGKKKGLVKKLEKEMKELAKKHEFEKAADLRNKIFALKHISDVALISDDKNPSLTLPFAKGENRIPSFSKGGRGGIFRIEAYDISNISGRYAVGAMVVFQGSEPDKAQYRKFKIKTIAGVDDIGAMREVLLRRFRNSWQMPDLILLDGGRGHLNMGVKVLKDLDLKIPIGAVAKGPTRKISNFQFLISEQFPISKFSSELKNIIADKNLVWNIMSEAHRFAIGYHRKLRKKKLFD